MAKAFLPERRIWTQQPQEPVEVDWANPIARKFSVILSGADWPTRNLANLAYQPTLLDGGVVSASVTAQGKTRLFSGQPTSGIGLDESCYVVAKESVSMTGPFTFFAWLRPSTFQQGNSDYITGIVSAYQQVSGTNNAPVMRFGGGAVAGTAKRLFVYANIGGVDRSILDSVDAVAGVTYFVVCTYDGAALKLWKNGALVGSVSCSGAVRTDAYTALTFLSDYQNISTGKAGNQPRGFSGDFILGGAAPYGVTSTEALSLYANPWQLFKPVTRRVYFDVGGSSGLTITPPLLTNSNSLYSPSVTPGAVGVSAPLLTSSSTLYAPTVSAGGSIVQAPLLTSTSDLFSPTLNPGAVQVAPPLLPSENAFFAPVVSAGGSVVQAPLLTNTSTTYGPTVGVGAVAIAPPLFTNSSTIYGPSVASSGPQTIDAPLLTNSSTIYAPSVGEVSPLSDAEMRHMYEMVQAIYAAVVTNAPLDVNLVRVRGQSIIGTGAAADPWGPA